MIFTKISKEQEDTKTSDTQNPPHTLFSYIINKYVKDLFCFPNRHPPDDSLIQTHK